MQQSTLKNGSKIMETVQDFIASQKKRAEAKIRFYNIEEIATVVTNSCPANFRAFDKEVESIDQILDYLADLYIRSHGGKLSLSFSQGLIRTKITWGNLEPDFISRKSAREQALLAVLAN